MDEKIIGKKVLLITNIPTPYRIPLFNELNNQLGSLGLKFKVIFGSLGYSRRKWKIDMSECKFQFEVMKSKKYQLLNPSKVIFFYSGLYKILKSQKPSLVITIGFSVCTFKIWLRSFFIKIDYLIWSGAILNRYENDSWPRKIYRKLLIKKAKGFIAYGSNAKEYLESLGAASGKIEVATNTVDIDYFSKQVEILRGQNKTEPETKKVFLSIGDLIKRKRFDQLLSVIEKLSRLRQDFVLKIVGDGVESESLKALATQSKIERYISWEGYKQKSEIPKYLAEADCFLFSTDYDLWGLVLVEAMAVGIPCVASIHAGAVSDLIEDGITGFKTDFCNVDEVVKRILWIMTNPSHARKIGEQGRKKILTEATITNSANGFVKAIKKVI